MSSSPSSSSSSSSPGSSASSVNDAVSSSAAVPMVVLSNGKRQCPAGYTQRPRKSGRCVPSTTRKRRPPAPSLAAPVQQPRRQSPAANSLFSPPLASLPSFSDITPTPQQSASSLLSPPLASLPSFSDITPTPQPASSLLSPPLASMPSASDITPSVAASSMSSDSLSSSSTSPGSSSVGSSSSSSSSNTSATSSPGSSSVGSSNSSNSSSSSSSSAASSPESSSSSSNNSDSSPSASSLSGISASSSSSPLDSSSSAAEKRPLLPDVELPEGKRRCPLGMRQRAGTRICTDRRNLLVTASSSSTTRKRQRRPAAAPIPVAPRTDTSRLLENPYYPVAATSAALPVVVADAAAVPAAAVTAARQRRARAVRAEKQFQTEREVYQANVAKYEENAAAPANSGNPFHSAAAADPSEAMDVDLFPDHDDPLFALQLARRAEFADTLYDGSTATPVAQRADEVCAASFEILPNQRFAQSLLSPESPVNAAFLYHELGTGKTFSCQTITEQFRRNNKGTGVSRPIYVIANPNVVANFRKQLFDETALRENRDTQAWEMGAGGTIGADILHELNPAPHLGRPTREALLADVKSLLDAAYTFIGYSSFANRIFELTADKEEEEKKRILRAHFDNCFIAVDEAHNVNQREVSGGTARGGNNSTAIELIARHCNVQLLLMSATPMFNSHRELVPLVNMLNAVDGRAPIVASQVFDAAGRFVEASVDEAGRSVESGRDLLARKLTGYVSFVRGETPFAFPFRVLPDTFLDMTVPADARHRLLPENYPKRQLNGRPVVHPLKFTQVFVSALKVYQRRVYLAHVMKMELVAKKKRQKQLLLQQQQQQGDDSSSSSGTDGSSLSSGGDDDDVAMEIDDDDEAAAATNDDNEDPHPLIAATDQDLAALPDFESAVSDDAQEGYNYAKLRTLMELATIVYPHTDWDDHLARQNPIGALNPEVLSRMTGRRGLKRYMKWDGGKASSGFNEPIRNFQYAGGLPGAGTASVRVFSPQHLPDYAAKIASLMERIRTSTGLVLVFSASLDASLIPIALALEQEGYQGVEGTATPGEIKERNLWHPEELSKVATKRYGRGGEPLRYTMVTGQRALSPNNTFNVALATDPRNIHGDRIKVVLYTVAGSESIDYKGARQVHIMEPWFNMNRLEQVIGRGVRNRSHCGLPFAQRNTEIYYHAAVLPNEASGIPEADDSGNDGRSRASDDASVLSVAASGASLASNDLETADLYLYRWAESKEKLMAPARRLLKEISVDCLTNVGQQNFTLAQMNQTVQLELSSRRRVVPFAVGDRPFSNMCDYEDDCRYACYVPSPILAATVAEVAAASGNVAAVAPAMQTAMTFGVSALNKDESRLVRRIQDLFREKPFYRFDELRAHLTVQRHVSETHIYAAVQALLRDPALQLINRAGLRGRLVAVTRRERRKRSSSSSSSSSSSQQQQHEKIWYLFQPLHVTDPRASVYERGHLAVAAPRAVKFGLQHYRQEEQVAAAAAVTEEDGEAAAEQEEPATAAPVVDKVYSPVYRASLQPMLLGFLAEKVLGGGVGIFGAKEDQEEPPLKKRKKKSATSTTTTAQAPEEEDRRTEAKEAAVLLARSWWMVEMRKIVALIRNPPSSADFDLDQVRADLPENLLFWMLVQNFLDSRPILERASILRNLVRADAAYLQTVDNVELWRKRPVDQMPDGTWEARATFLMRRYFAERVYVSARGGRRAAVLADMDGKHPFYVSALPLPFSDEEGGGEGGAADAASPPPALTTLLDAGDWLKEAYEARAAPPNDLEQQVKDAQARGLKWTVLVSGPTKEANKTSGWNPASKLRIKTLTDSRINNNGGSEIVNQQAQTKIDAWNDMAVNVPAAAPKSGVGFIRGRSGNLAAAILSVLLYATQYNGGYAALTGEEFIPHYFSPP